MMDPAKPGGRARPPPLAMKSRMRTASDDALAHRWDPQQPVAPPSPAAAGKRSPDPFAVETVKLYPSYVVQSGHRTVPYEAHVQGWLYAAGVNKKGRLMCMAVERLIANPGKYTSIADAAAHTQAEEIPDVEEPSYSLFGLSSLRPFRPRGSRGSAPNSQPPSAAASRSNSRSNSRNSSRTPSRASSPEPGDSLHHSSPSLAASPGPQSPGSPHSTGSIDSLSSAAEEPPKRPGMRRTATYTFDARSNPKGKASSPAARAHSERKHIVRERLAAITHKSLSMREVRITVFSEPNSDGTRKKAEFYRVTDDSGRFTGMCPVPFRPARVRASAGNAVAFSDCYHVPPSGISVISDIDDTVRYTGVTKSKKELLQNVLVKGFDECSIDGVRDWFQRMADAGATFHYVSNSPWQLYDVIDGYLKHHRFPEGSVHLKKYAGVFDGLTEPAKGRKRATLEKILQDFPERRFILIGDSGEADLEAYAELARKFPLQVVAIYIRDITTPPDEALYDPRMQTAHRRHHSADLLPNIDEPADPAVAKPELPPRRRAPLAAPPLPARKPLEQSPQMPAKSPSDPMVVSALENEPATPDESSECTVKLDAESNAYVNPDHPSQPEENTVPGKVNGGVALPVITTTPTKAESPPPKPPPRPKLLRRTSSKILDGVNAMASASSHAVGSAARLLGPHHSNDHAHPASNSTGHASAKPKLKSSRMASLSIGDDTPDYPVGSHNKDSFSESRSSSSPSGSFSRRSDVSPASPKFHSDVNDSGVFITSSQDFVDIDRPDKRAEQWNMRMLKQRRLLPRHVELKSWRQPRDVEAQALRYIESNRDSA